VTHHPIDFHPWRNNILDYMDRADLVTPNGTPVVLRRQGLNFFVQVGNMEPVITDNNGVASYVLNQYEVGIMHS